MKLVHGIVINDSQTPVTKVVDGKRVMCPYYRKWKNMIQRAYDGKNKNYSESTVCDEWLTFSNFRYWMMNQDWQGKHLDKDLLVSGNKVYSPETCIFLDVTVNTFITDMHFGNLSKGVCLSNCKGKYAAYISINGRSVCLGSQFDTELQASEVYVTRKHLLSQRLALKQQDQRVANALKIRYERVLTETTK